MPKLIPISDSQMKKLGIVKSKNGFLMREQQIKKIVEDKKVKAASKPGIVKADVKFVPRQTQTVQVVAKPTKQEAKKAMEDRGIY